VCIWLLPCSLLLSCCGCFPAVLLLHVSRETFPSIPCIPIYPCRLLLSMRVLLYNLIIIRARKIDCYFP